MGGGESGTAGHGGSLGRSVTWLGAGLLRLVQRWLGSLSTRRAGSTGPAVTTIVERVVCPGTKKPGTQVPGEGGHHSSAVGGLEGQPEP